MRLAPLKQKVNYSKIVRGKDLDRKTYAKKFKLWDYVLKKRLLEKGDGTAIKLLNDTTVYSYAFLRDLSGNPLKLTSYQDAIVGCSHDFSPYNHNRFVVFKSANQTGKSWALIAMAIHHVMTQDNINVIMVSKTLPQSQYLLAQIRQMLNNSLFGDTWREDLGETANTTVLTFERDSGKIVNRIICAPCGEGLLGYPVHYLYLDEADFYENAKTFFWKIAVPRTNKTKGQIVVFSNPNPDISRQVSLLWDIWAGEHKTLFKRKFSFNFLDCPWNTKKEYESLKKQYPSFYFQATYDGDFPLDSGGFFSFKEIKDMIQNDWRNELPIVDRPVFIGLDLAKMKDRTVLSLGVLKPNKEDEKISDLEVKYMKGFPTKTDYDIVIHKLKEIVDFYKDQHQGVAAIGLDVSGVGRAVSDFARAARIKVTDVKFSLENKSRMYGNFKLLAEQRRVRIANIEECEKQLSSLVFKRTPAGYLSVHHEKESIKDDYPDSICALIDVSIMPSKVPVSITFVDRAVSTSNKTVLDGVQDSREMLIAQTIKANSPTSYGNEFDEIRGFSGW